MKILLVNDFKETIGGAEIYMHSLADVLRANGHTVQVFAPSVSYTGYVEQCRQSLLSVRLRRIWNEPARKEFARLYWDFLPDVVHIQSFASQLSPSFLSVIKQETQVVMTVHDLRIAAAVLNQELRTGRPCSSPVCPGCPNCIGVAGTVYEQLRRFVESPLLNRIDTVICPSRYVYTMLHRYTRIGPLVHLPNGFDLLPEVPFRSSRTIAYIGRLVPEKGVEVLLSAFATAASEIPGIHLRIIGTGPAEYNLKKLMKKHQLEGSVTFAGAVSHTEISNELASADIVCIPSVYPDNLPTVGIEALATGRPLVVSNAGGLSDLVDSGKNGYLVPPGNSKELARTLVAMLSDPEQLKKMSSASRTKADTFAMKHHIRRLVDIYLGKV